MRRTIPPRLRRLAPRGGLRQQIAASRDRLYRIAYSWCHDSALAEDLVHDTLISAFAGFDRLRDPSRLDVWLTRILANRFRDHLRRPAPEAGWDTDIAGRDNQPEHDLMSADIVRRTRAAIDQLGEEQRQVLTLVDLAEFSYADAARILDIPQGTVMSRLARARQRLREMLQSTHQDSGHHIVPFRPRQ